MKNKGFTLSETLVVLFLLGVIASVTIPALWHSRPNESRLMFRKAYYDTERVISDMINDDSLYPESDESPPDFGDSTGVTVMGVLYAGKTKFCGIFADKMNTSGEINCEVNPPTGTSYTTPSFTSTNGIAWYVPTTENVGAFLARGGAPEYIKIRMDINGKKPPNCRCDVEQDATGKKECPTSCLGPDQFEIIVRADGKINVKGVREIEYLGTNDLR